MLYKAAAVTFGEELQLAVATEELAELQQQICKALRGKLDKRHLTEEIVDALIGIEQVIQMFEISDAAIRGMKIRKQQRLVRTIAAARNVTEDVLIKWMQSLEDI